MLEKIDESNVLLYAARFYDNPSCYDTVEFYEDLKRVSYIKRLFNKYEQTGDIKVRLIVNHLIVLYNVFGSFANYILFIKLREYLPTLIPFLILIQKCPRKVDNIGLTGDTVFTSDINIDQDVVDILRESYGKF